MGSVVSGLASLRKLSTKILEPSLTDQILGAFGPKLKEIEITGKDLQSITLDAFEGTMSLIISDTGSVCFSEIPYLYFNAVYRIVYIIIGIESQELLLTIRGTSIKELPTGFYEMFKSVSHLSFDLRNNQFETLPADVFYDTSERPWEQVGTKVIKGRKC